MIIRASEVGRVIQCPASLVLPRKESTSAAAERGTAIHAYLRERANGKKHDEIEIPKEYAKDVDVLRDFRFPDGAKAEVSIAYDLDTNRAIHLPTSDYTQLDPAHRWLAGTVDLIWADDDKNEIHVLDYKTGWTYDVGYRYQVEAYAVLAEQLDQGWADLFVLHLAYIHEDQVYLKTWDYDVFSCVSLRDAIKRASEQAPYAEPAPGNHCRWCPCADTCPAMRGLVLSMAYEPGKAVDIGGDLTPETAARAWERLKLIEAACKTVREALYGFARMTPFPLANGAVVGPVEVQRENVNGNLAYSVINKMLGPVAAALACDFDSSKAAIARAVKALIQQGQLEKPISKRTDEILQAIREAGGIEVRLSSTVREHAP